MAQQPFTRAHFGRLKQGDFPMLARANIGRLYAPVFEKFPFTWGGEIDEEKLREIVKRDPVQDWAVILMATIH